MRFRILEPSLTIVGVIPVFLFLRLPTLQVAVQAYHFPIRHRGISSISSSHYHHHLKARYLFGQASLLRDNHPRRVLLKGKQQSSRSTMFMSSLASTTGQEYEPSSSKVLLSNRSLASAYVISMDTRNHHHQQQQRSKSFYWKFHPIENDISKDDTMGTTGTAGKGGVGEKALRAMHHGNLPPQGSFYLKCQVVQDQGLRIETDSKEQGELISIMARVMAQTALDDDFFENNQTISMEVPRQDDPTRLCCETYSVKDLKRNTGYAPLFASFFPPETKMDDVEMSDMVDGEGNPIGYIPRPLLHKFNVLHRGVGILVCNDSHDALSSKIYVHQRVETKRIFPSLYDMFVGGVSTSGEDLKVTAAREVGEELGLTRSSLSDELFQCTICTSYNRCVVTVFTYRFDPNLDEVKWQEEEVQWGDFVDYNLVEKSAALSIERLVASGCWPGSERDTNAVEAIRFGSDCGETMSLENDWDYVPDGLLVWVAWIQWLGNKKNSATTN